MDIEGNYDIAIIDTGPAGLQTAIHSFVEKLMFLIIGNLWHSYQYPIENYCCLENTSTGNDILKHVMKQAAKAVSEVCVAGIKEVENIKR